MALIQGVNGIHINQYSGVNAGTRILSFGKALPGDGVWYNMLAFTLISGASANFGIAFRFFGAAERQSGTIAENFWFSAAGNYYSSGTSWYDNWTSAPWYSGDGNGIINYRIAISGTTVALQGTQGDTGAYVGGYAEAQCSKWDQLTISY